MRVLYDHSVFSAQRVGGVPRYFTELIVKSEGLHESTLATLYSDTIYLREHTRFRDVLPFPPSPRPVGWNHPLIKRVMRKLGLPGKPSPHDQNLNVTLAALRSQEFDVFHPTYYEQYLLEVPVKEPVVLTVYDMIHEVHPELFPISDDTFRRKAAFVERADKIIAISESTRDELIRFHPSAASKTEVIWLGPSFEVGQVPRLPGLPERFILFTGSRGGYKNFYFFVHVVARLLIEEPDLFLICTGGGFQAEELELLCRLGIKDKVVHRFANETELRQLYQAAQCFVFPSYHEGFGFPVLEAFASGCPAVLSRSTSLPEVGSDAALYFDPKDPEQLLSAVRQALHDRSLREDLVLRGFERLKAFSWTTTARRTHEVYESVMRGSQKTTIEPSRISP